MSAGSGRDVASDEDDRHSANPNPKLSPSIGSSSYGSSSESSLAHSSDSSTIVEGLSSAHAVPGPRRGPPTRPTVNTGRHRVVRGEARLRAESWGSVHFSPTHEVDDPSLVTLGGFRTTSPTATFETPKDFDTIAAPGGFTCPPDKPIRFTAPTLRNRYERNIVMLVCSLTLMLLR